MRVWTGFKGRPSRVCVRRQQAGGSGWVVLCLWPSPAAPHLAAAINGASLDDALTQQQHKQRQAVLPPCETMTCDVIHVSESLSSSWSHDTTCLHLQYHHDWQWCFRCSTSRSPACPPRQHLILLPLPPSMAPPFP